MPVDTSSAVPIAERNCVLCQETAVYSVRMAACPVHQNRRSDTHNGPVTAPECLTRNPFRGPRGKSMVMLRTDGPLAREGIGATAVERIPRRRERFQIGSASCRE